MELFVGGSTVEELEVDGRVASVEAGRVAKGVEVVELFVGGLAVEELEVDDRVAAVEVGRLTEGVDEKVAEGVDERIEQFVGGCIPVVPLINSIISSQKNSLVIEMLTNYAKIVNPWQPRDYRMITAPLPSGFALGYWMVINDNSSVLVLCQLSSGS